MIYRSVVESSAAAITRDELKLSHAEIIAEHLISIIALHTSEKQLFRAMKITSGFIMNGEASIRGKLRELNQSHNQCVKQFADDLLSLDEKRLSIVWYAAVKRINFYLV